MSFKPNKNLPSQSAPNDLTFVAVPSFNDEISTLAAVHNDFNLATNPSLIFPSFPAAFSSSVCFKFLPISSLNDNVLSASLCLTTTLTCNVSVPNLFLYKITSLILPGCSYR